MPVRELVSGDAHRIALGGHSVDYVLVRRRGRRGVGLRVDELGLKVSAPLSMRSFNRATLSLDGVVEYAMAG